MAARDMFGLFVRGLGTVLVAVGLVYLVASLLGMVGLPMSPETAGPISLIGAVCYGGPGLLFLLGANWIVRVTYGRENRT